jgi:hypothetical protein
LQRGWAAASSHWRPATSCNTGAKSRSQQKGAGPPGNAAAHASGSRGCYCRHPSNTWTASRSWQRIGRPPRDRAAARARGIRRCYLRHPSNACPQIRPPVLQQVQQMLEQLMHVPRVLIQAPPATPQRAPRTSLACDDLRHRLRPQPGRLELRGVMSRMDPCKRPSGPDAGQQDARDRTGRVQWIRTGRSGSPVMVHRTGMRPVRDCKSPAVPGLGTTVSRQQLSVLVARFYLVLNTKSSPKPSCVNSHLDHARGKPTCPVRDNTFEEWGGSFKIVTPFSIARRAISISIAP